VSEVAAARRRALVMALVSPSIALSLVTLPRMVTAAVTCAPAVHAGGEWRSYGHDLSNTRTQDQESVISPSNAPTLAPAWTFQSKGQGDFTGTPVIADGCVFAGSNNGWAYALNADTGDVVWRTQLTTMGGINASMTVTGGMVFTSISVVGQPAVAALDEGTGQKLWETVIDTQPGSDVYSSPVVFNGMVLSGWSGGSAELADTKTRFALQGGFVLLDAATGTLLKKTYSIHSPALNGTDKLAGAGIWATAAVDPASQLAFVGTGNPFQPQAMSPHTDAILKIDVNPNNATFGTILGSYQGIPDTYANTSRLPCVAIPNNPPPYYPQGLGSCGQIDLDFGSSPNLMHAADGSLRVGEGQKSGAYHIIDAATMSRRSVTVVGPPGSVGGIVGSTAFDGTAVYGPVTEGGYLWSVDTKGNRRWVMPMGDGAHYGNPTAAANGVVYSVDFTGSLDAFKASTGQPLLHRSVLIGSHDGAQPPISWGGVSIARNTVYAAIGTTALSNGLIVAFRPGPLTGVAAPAGAQFDTATVAAHTYAAAGPGGQFAGFATRVVVASRSGTLTFINEDIVQHDFDSTTGLFWTPLIGLNGRANVQGLANLVAGKRYPFFCTIHPGMTGTLVVIN
jgi:polyvinyl alcohol dehydrogenase (cytochrome)